MCSGPSTQGAGTNTHLESNTGNLVTNEVFSRFVAAMGYDSIVLLDANRRFDRMNIPAYTCHVHLFADNDAVHVIDRVFSLDAHYDTPAISLAA